MADEHGLTGAMDSFQRKAFDLVVGAEGRKAFDISKEDPKLRDRYGRNTWGQSTLLARRLVEAGSTFVTVHYGGWDHHWDLQKGMENYLPMVDSAVATLFEDLSDRGLDQRVLVVLCGEFSRTPKMNDGGNGGPPLSMGTPAATIGVKRCFVCSVAVVSKAVRSLGQPTPKAKCQKNGR